MKKRSFKQERLSEAVSRSAGRGSAPIRRNRDEATTDWPAPACGTSSPQHLTPMSECIITFELTDTPETFALWPHRFRLILKLTVGKTLTLELTTHNTFNEQRALEKLPVEIESLEAKIDELNASLADPKKYEKIGISVLAEELEKTKALYEEKVDELLSIEEKAEEIEALKNS